VRNALLQYATGAEKMYHYDLINDGTDPNYGEANFGLLDYTGTAKPAGTNLVQLKAFLTGYEYVGWNKLNNPACYFYIFRKVGAT
jgi:hypothetical protein